MTEEEQAESASAADWDTEPLMVFYAGQGSGFVVDEIEVWMITAWMSRRILHHSWPALKHHLQGEGMERLVMKITEVP